MKTYEISDGIMIYYLPKELDHYAAEMIKRKSETVFQVEQVRYLIFDFEKTEFMDSSGIGLITGRFRKISDEGGRVFAVNVGENIDRILKMSGIYRIVDKRNTKGDIIKEIGKGGYYE